MWSLFYLRGHVDDWIDTHQIGLASAQVLGDKQAELWVRNNLGVGYIHARRPDAAVGCFRQNLAIVRAAGDQLALPRTMLNLGYGSPGRPWPPGDPAAAQCAVPLP